MSCCDPCVQPRMRPSPPNSATRAVDAGGLTWREGVHLRPQQFREVVEVARDHIEALTRHVVGLALRTLLQRSRDVGGLETFLRRGGEVVGMGGDQHYLGTGEAEQRRWHVIGLWVGLVLMRELRRYH